MNEILFLVGGICIVGSSFYFANKHVKENDGLREDKQNLIINCEELRENVVDLHETIKNKDVVIGKMDEEIKELHKTILFDNDLMTKKTKRNEKLKEDLKFACSVAFARYDEINYLRKKINVIRSKRLLKVVRAEKLF